MFPGGLISDVVLFEERDVNEEGSFKDFVDDTADWKIFLLKGGRETKYKHTESQI